MDVMETELTTKILQKIREDIAALTESMNRRFDAVEAQITTFRREFDSFRDFVVRKFEVVDNDIGVLSRAVLRPMDGQAPKRPA